MKTCSKCGESKPLEDYHVRKDSKDGRVGQCRSCVKVKSDTWYQANKDRHLTNSKQNYKENKKRKAVTGAIWQKANKESRAASSAAYRIRHPDRAHAWARENPEKHNEKRRKYRARKVNNGVKLVIDTEIATIAAMSCTACGIAGPSEVDHIIPLARGGSHTIGNLMPLCKSCNSSKRDLLYIEWKYSKRPQAQKAFASP